MFALEAPAATRGRRRAGWHPAPAAVACFIACACHRSPASGEAPATASATAALSGTPSLPASAAPAWPAPPAATDATDAAPPLFAATAPSVIEEGFRRLYDCARKANDTYYDASYPFAILRDYELRFLERDLSYLLDERGPEIYFYTPRSAAKADLPGIRRRNGTLDYGVRVPYLAAETSKSKGNYYVQLRERGGSVQVAGIDRFLPGAPQSTPDFTGYEPPLQPNGVTLTSVTGQRNSGVEYYPLAEERQLWDRDARGHLSEEAERALASLVHFMLSNLSPLHYLGQRTDCWGHAGCTYVCDEARVTAERRARDEAIRSCRSADESHLGLF